MLTGLLMTAMLTTLVFSNTTPDKIESLDKFQQYRIKQNEIMVSNIFKIFLCFLDEIKTIKFFRILILLVNFSVNAVTVTIIKSNISKKDRQNF